MPTLSPPLGGAQKYHVQLGLTWLLCRSINLAALQVHLEKKKIHENKQTKGPPREHRLGPGSLCT